MRRRITYTPSIKLIATSSFACQKVRISTTQTSRTHWLMRIHHNSTISSLFKNTIIMIYHPLSIVILTSRNNTTYITRLHRIIAILFHKIKGLINTTFIVSCRTRSFMMHNKFYPFSSCISSNFFHIKVGIRSNEIKHLFFPLTSPIFPTNIPTFNQHSVKAMLCSKINITHSILGCCSMTSVWSQFRPISLC